MKEEYSIRHKDTGEVVHIRHTEQCCYTCRHYGFAPGGFGPCAILDVYYKDSPAEYSQLHTCYSDVCNFWEEKDENQRQRNA